MYVAFAAGVTGPIEETVAGMINSIELYFDEVNAAGGIDGHQVRLLVYDDENDTEMARGRAEEIVEDGRALAVIGHGNSGESLAASPVYEAAGLPAVTATSTADAVTGSPWYLSTVFSNTAQGEFMAAYIHQVLGATSVIVVAGTHDYGRSLADGFVEAFTTDGSAERIDLTAGDDGVATDAAIEAAVAEIAAASTDTVVLALQASEAVRMVSSLNRAGVDAAIVGGDSLGSTSFLARLEEAVGGHADDLVADTYTLAPLILDSLSGDAVRWFFGYQERYGVFPPGWHAATSYDAAVAIVHAMRTGGLELDDTSRAPDRARVLEVLAGMDSPENSIHGIVAPLWFDEGGAGVMPIAVGRFEDERLISAPDQLLPFEPPPGAPLDKMIAQGQVVEFDGTYYQRRRVVTVGIKVNEISELDTQSQTFTADFFIWLEFTGDDDVADIQFVNAVDPGLPLGDPVRVSETGQTSYRLHRVKAQFKSELDFRDFPFDEQQLTIDVQHATLPASRVVLKGATEILGQTQQERLTSGANAAVSINAIPEWTAHQVVYFQGTVSSAAALGDPTLQGGQTGLAYSEFITAIDIGRDVPAFLVKNLLPLLLLALATYTSLYFSHTQTASRVSFGITGILTGAVLLTNVTSSLPNVGYAVAIEWAYYVFIMLSGGLVVVALTGGRLNDQRDLVRLRRLDLTARLVFPTVVVVTVLGYVALLV